MRVTVWCVLISGVAYAIDWLFSPLEADHCRVAYLAEINRHQLPHEMRWEGLVGERVGVSASSSAERG